MPLAIDELPLVALLGCFAEGETVVTGAEELRHKESDRIAAVVDGLRGARRRDRGARGRLRGARHRRPARRRLDARGDHRLAMLGAVAGLASRDGVEVRRDGGRRRQLPGLRSGPRGADAALGSRRKLGMEVAVAFQLDGQYFENCSCEVVCPCTVSLALGADYDRCQVILVFHVDSGDVDGTDVSGLTVAAVADTPKVMSDGGWRLGS